MKRGRKPHVSPEQWALWSNGEVHTLVRGEDFDKPLVTMRSILRSRALTQGMKLRANAQGDDLVLQVVPQGESFTLRRTRPRGSPTLEQRRGILIRFAGKELSLEETQAQCGGISRQRVYQLVRAAGLTVERRDLLDSFPRKELERCGRGEVSVEALARKVGSSPQYVRKLLGERGIRPPRRQPESTAFRLPAEDVAAYLNRETTLDALADKHGLHRMSIVGALRRARAIRNPRPGRFTLTEDECRRLKQGQTTIGEVARVRGVSRGTVHWATVAQLDRTPPAEFF